MSHLLIAAFDLERHISVAKIVSDVPTKLFSRKSGRGEQVTFDLFKKCYPDLDIINPPGDGSSCLYDSVSEAICGDTSLSRVLRVQAVSAIDRRWGEVGEFAIAEVADQATVAADTLGKSECLRLLLEPGPGGHFLWGNAVTLHHLPEVVGMNIAVLTVSDGSPFKTVLKPKGLASGTIFVGFIPEVHFFGVRARLDASPIIGVVGSSGKFFQDLQVFISAFLQVLVGHDAGILL